MQSYSGTVGKKQVPFLINRKCGTHARVVSQTLAHGNSINKIKIKKGKEGKKGGVSMESSKWARKKKVPTA